MGKRLGHSPMELRSVMYELRNGKRVMSGSASVIDNSADRRNEEVRASLGRSVNEARFDTSYQIFGLEPLWVRAAHNDWPRQWKFDRVIYSTDRLLLLGDAAVCLNATTGELLWWLQAGRGCHEFLGDLDNRLAFVASPQGNIVAVDWNAGQQIWHQKAPLIPGGTIFDHGSGVIVAAGTGPGSLRFIDAFTGQSKWEQPIKGSSQVSKTSSAFPVAFSGGVVASALDGAKGLFGNHLNDGNPAYSYPYVYVPELLRRDPTSMGLPCVRLARRQLVASSVTTRDGSILYEEKPPGPDNCQAVRSLGGVTKDGRPLLWLDYQNAWQVLSIALPDGTWSHTQYSENRAELFWPHDSVVLVLTDSYVQAIDARTGQLLWHRYCHVDYVSYSRNEAILITETAAGWVGLILDLVSGWQMASFTINLHRKSSWQLMLVPDAPCSVSLILADQSGNLVACRVSCMDGTR